MFRQTNTVVPGVRRAADLNCDPERDEYFDTFWDHFHQFQATTSHALRTMLCVARLHLTLPLLLLFVGGAHGQASGNVTTLAGVAGTPGSTDGVGSAVKFYFPQGVSLDAAGTVALVVSA
jgi:hypothetical protein